MHLRLSYLKFFISFVLLASTSFTLSFAARPDKQSLPTVIPTPQYASNEVLIKFKQQFTSSERSLLKKQLNAGVSSRTEALQAFHSHFNTTPKGSEFMGWQRVTLPSSRAVNQALTDFKQTILVESIEPNYLRKTNALSTTYTAYAAPDDPYYQDGETLWWFNRIKSDLAYSQSHDFGTKDIIVAVIDTGVDLDHSEFTSVLVDGYNAITPSALPDDDFYHGTHVAGLVAAIADNTVGICGTGFSNHIKIMPVKVLNSAGEGTTADIVEGIYWAVNNGAKVINMSFGGYGLSQSEQESCTYAYEHGCVLVAASGNDNLNTVIYPCYPACFDNVIAVGATDASDCVTLYSNGVKASSICQLQAVIRAVFFRMGV